MSTPRSSRAPRRGWISTTTTSQRTPGRPSDQERDFAHMRTSSSPTSKPLLSSTAIPDCAGFPAAAATAPSAADWNQRPISPRRSCAPRDKDWAQTLKRKYVAGLAQEQGQELELSRIERLLGDNELD